MKRVAGMPAWPDLYRAEMEPNTGVRAGGRNAGRDVPYRGDKRSLGTQRGGVNGEN
ncbi:MAG: hypothetical protein WB699_11670 [Bacteroidota bacterium]